MKLEFSIERITELETNELLIETVSVITRVRESARDADSVSVMRGVSKSSNSV